MTTATIIDGNVLAQRIKTQTVQQVCELKDQSVHVSLDAVMVGDPAAGQIYARSQKKRCDEVGIEYRLHALHHDASETDIRVKIRELNENPKVTGILLNLPLPDHIDTPAMQYCIDPYKDVEGVNPANIGLLFYGGPIIAPCTALAVMEILNDAGIKPKGLDAVVVGQGVVAGKPVSLFLLHELATVTCCHIETRDLQQHTREADILIVAVGKQGLITTDHVKPGATVIDVGINRIQTSSGEKQIVGDVDFENVKEVAGVITPVPGGVGPLTVAILLRSAAEAARQQLTTPRRLES